MSRTEQKDVGEPLNKTVGRDPIAQDLPPRPQEESLKRHGDELQDLVDKATDTPRSH